MGNWTPTGFGGAFFGAVTQLVPPPQGQKPPSLWGTEDHFRQLFGDRVTLEVKPQHFVFHYRSPAHWIEVFSTTFGPVMKALEALDDPGRERLRLELHRVTGNSTSNRRHDGCPFRIPRGGGDEIVIALSPTLSDSLVTVENFQGAGNE
jgi:hypothetical protein